LAVKETGQVAFHQSVPIQERGSVQSELLADAGNIIFARVLAQHSHSRVSGDKPLKEENYQGDPNQGRND
jgi:hypothetical protein